MAVGSWDESRRMSGISRLVARKVGWAFSCEGSGCKVHGACFYQVCRTQILKHELPEISA